MASTVSAGAASVTLKYQTWVLKVSINCEGCKKKVQKVLRRIDGVYTTVIDPQQDRVTVTGDVDVQTLIKKLMLQTGKHAEVWPENLTGKENKSVKTKNKDKQRDPQAHSNENRAEKNNASEGHECKKTKNGQTSLEKSPGGQRSPAVELSGGRRVTQGAGPHYSGRTRQISYPYPPEYHPPYYCYVPSAPYTCATNHQEADRVKAPCVDPLHIFSDENANGCFIM